MPKNNKLINSLAAVAARNREANMRAASERDLPQIYSAIALALWNMLALPDEEKADAIEDIFAESQKIWEESWENGEDMVEKCKDLTGIDIMAE